MITRYCLDFFFSLALVTIHYYVSLQDISQKGRSQFFFTTIKVINENSKCFKYITQVIEQTRKYTGEKAMIICIMEATDINLPNPKLSKNSSRDLKLYSQVLYLLLLYPNPSRSHDLNQFVTPHKTTLLLNSSSVTETYLTM